MPEPQVAAVSASAPQRHGSQGDAIHLLFHTLKKHPNHPLWSKNDHKLAASRAAGA
ncbi:hypothetical protein ACFQ4K_27710 [Tistrella bauzanensis]